MRTDPASFVCVSNKVDTSYSCIIKSGRRKIYIFIFLNRRGVTSSSSMRGR